MSKRPKWTKERRAKTMATLAKKRADRKVFSEAKPRLREFAKELQRDNVIAALQHSALPHQGPEFIYVLINGKLQRWQLRNMPIYMPDDEPKP